MGHKVVCFNCRKAFNIGTDYERHVPEKCPECGQEIVHLNHKFRPPKSKDTKAWEVVKYLYDHGFAYQHIYKDLSLSGKVNAQSSDNFVEYPDNLREAKEFVITYGNQALHSKRFED